MYAETETLAAFLTPQEEEKQEVLDDKLERRLQTIEERLHYLERRKIVIRWVIKGRNANQFPKNGETG